MLKPQLLSAAAGLLVLATASAARADFRYAFDQGDLQLVVGMPTSVAVYLEESADTEAAGVIAAQHGLAAASVLLQKVTADTAVTITGVTPSPGFDPVATVTDPAAAPFAVDAASIFGAAPDPLLTVPAPTDGLPAVQVTPGVPIWRVLIGWFELSASAPTAQPVLFQAALRDITSDAATFDAFYGDNPTYDLLQNPTGPAILSADLSVTAVPEPATLALLAIGLTALARRR